MVSASLLHPSISSGQSFAVDRVMRNKLSKQAMSSCLPIVCIGASAGGLESFSELLARFPAATGIAYVTSVISVRGD
jgi:chemotaxis response regulator CheB